MLLSMLLNRFHLVSQIMHWVAAGTRLESPWHTEFGQKIRERIHSYTCSKLQLPYWFTERISCHEEDLGLHLTF